VEQKPWWQSKTLRGLIVAAVAAIAPKYTPLLDLVGPVLDTVSQVAQVGGLAYAAYGRVKTDGKKLVAKMPAPTEGN
jgi:hypothetical protein